VYNSATIAVIADKRQKGEIVTNVGDETKGKDLGYTNTPNERTIFVWVQCPRCKEERWARKRAAYNPVNNLHRLCELCKVKNFFRAEGK
jgi:hypothetical protein